MPDSKKPDIGEEDTVVDRRRFTSEGAIRPEVVAEQAAQKAAEPPPKPAPRIEPPRPEAPSGSAREAEKAYESRRPRHEAKMDFRTMVLSLSTTAMYQLGLMAEPGAPATQPDPEAARQTIDLLGVLEEKTRNNLSAEEKRLLEQVLYELRMSYMALGRK